MALPSDAKFVLVVTASATIRLSESPSPDELASVKTTKMRYPVKPGGPTGYRILYYEGVTSED